MPTFLLISRHTPEDCPIFNEKTKKMQLAAFDKMDKLEKKYKLKIDAWSVPNEHLSVMICEGSFEDVMKASMEPEMMALNAFSTTEVKPALNMEETMKMIRGK
jgi:hypothetical protein